MTTVLTEIKAQEQQQQSIKEKISYTTSLLQLSTTTDNHNTAPTTTITNMETETEIRNRSEKSSRGNNSLYDVFLTSVLYILHFTYISFIAFKTLHSYLYNVYSSIRYNSQNIHQRIQHDKSQLTKLPQHLTINVSRELLSSRTLEDWEETMYNISFATCWAWEFGIKEVSVYEASGVMKSMAVDLYKQQSAMLHQWINTSSLEEKKRPAIKFSILSGENGKAHMGQVTQEIAISAKNEKIDIKLVDEYMHVDNISDPDLMIVYDGLPHNYISLDGYPPWHIRLTEITNCSNYHRLNYDLFSKCLYRFSRVEQRFGH